MTLKTPAKVRVGITLMIVLGGACFFLLFLEEWSAKEHGVVLGILTATFAICETFFRSLASDLSALLRSSSLSFFQKQRMFAIAKPAKDRLVQNSLVLIVLKVFAAIAVGILSVGSGPTGLFKDFVLFGGYSAIFLSFPLMVLFYHHWRRIDNFLDKLSLADAGRKDRERLMKELTQSAKPLTDPDDAQLKGYTTVAPWR